MANRIGSLIAKADRAMLRELGPGSSSKELWSRVNEIRKSSNAHTPPSGFTADALNNRYAIISIDPAYTEPPNSKQTNAAGYRAIYARHAERKRDQQKRKTIEKQREGERERKRY